jgi:hypothetical protein
VIFFFFLSFFFFFEKKKSVVLAAKGLSRKCRGSTETVIRAILSALESPQCDLAAAMVKLTSQDKPKIWRVFFPERPISQNKK